jgi:hypothetical protein
MSMAKICPTKEELQAMYCDQKMSVRDIAAKLGCGATHAQRLLKRASVVGRPFGDHQDPRRNAKIAAWRATQFSPMTNSFVKGAPHKTINGKKQRIYRCVAEAVIGRNLASGEVVHHCDNNQRNNRPDNLWVFPSRSDHTRYHRTGIIHFDTIKLSELVMVGAGTEAHTEVA